MNTQLLTSEHPATDSETSTDQRNLNHWPVKIYWPVKLSYWTVKTLLISENSTDQWNLFWSVKSQLLTSMLQHHALAVSTVLPAALILDFELSSPWLTFVSGVLLKAACQCGFMHPTLTRLSLTDSRERLFLCAWNTNNESQPSLHYNFTTLTSFKSANHLSWNRN